MFSIYDSALIQVVYDLVSPLRMSSHHLALAVLASQPLKSETLSLHLSMYLYQSWYLPSSPQDPLLPVRFPIHLTPLFLHLRFGFCWPLCAFRNYVNFLTYFWEIWQFDNCFYSSLSCLYAVVTSPCFAITYRQSLQAAAASLFSMHCER